MSAHRAPLMTFLPLGPVVSASYPKSQQAQPPVEAGAEHKRRSSSLSSTGSDGGKPASYKVLKVAPVHYGEHAGDHKDDWHEVAVE